MTATVEGTVGTDEGACSDCDGAGVDKDGVYVNIRSFADSGIVSYLEVERGVGGGGYLTL